MNIIVELNTYQPPMATFDGVTQDGKEYHKFKDREKGQPEVKKKKNVSETLLIEMVSFIVLF